MSGASAADAVVIGGGINGAAISYYLARAGLRAAVLEASRPGAGASSRGAGIIRTYHHLPAETALAVLSLGIFRGWADEIGGTCGYAPTGFMWLVGPKSAEEVRTNVAVQHRLGATAEVISPETMIDLQPHLGLTDAGAAVFEPHGGFGEPMAATGSLHAAAARLGAELRQNVGVASISVSAGRVTGVATSSGSISTPIVILAAGAWSARLAATAGVTIPMIPTRMTTGTIRHEPFVTSPVTFIDTVTDTFYRPTAVPGTAHVSIRDARHNSAVDPAADWANEPVAAEASEQAIERLARRIPLLAATPLRAWVGVDGVTPDYRPIYGPAPGVEGLFLCVGGNFKGFKVAPGVGLCLADLVTGCSPSIDLTPFQLDRFRSAIAPTEPPPYALAAVA